MSQSCTNIQPELVGFHFGEVEQERRRELEEHLLACNNCLQDFLALKREIETAETDAAPSRAARLRLRDAVAKQVRAPERRWSWWERPFAVLTASVAVAVALLALNTVSTGSGTMPRSLTSPPTAPTQIQSHRPGPRSQ